MHKISVLLPIHNAAHTLRTCLDSILRQSLREFELIMVDDGSDDGSTLILQEYARQDHRLKLYTPGRIGLVQALNLGLNAAHSDFIARMDADDIMHPDRLLLQHDYLLNHPTVSLVGTQVEAFPKTGVRQGYQEYIDWQNRCVTPEEIERDIYLESPLAHPSVMYRKSSILAVGGYLHGDFPEDYELWLRLHHRGYRMAKIPRTLMYWRDSEYRTSRTDSRYSTNSFDRLRAHYLAKDPLLQNGHPFVIWGAGRKSRKRAQFLIEHGHAPLAWIDIDPRKIGNVYMSAPVHSPDWLNRKDKPLVLSYVNNHGARLQIDTLLKQFNYKHGKDFIFVG